MHDNNINRLNSLFYSFSFTIGCTLTSFAVGDPERTKFILFDSELKQEQATLTIKSQKIKVILIL